jgi:predicted MPP superfamily phosphohydrolase
VLGSSSVLAAAGTVQARQLAEVRRVQVPIEGLHADLVGLRIAQISDLHLGPILGRAWLEEVVTAVNGLRADLVAVTGDLVDGTVGDLREDVGALRRLRAPRGVYYVTGNHEYYWDALAWVDEVRRLGLDALVNEHRVLAIGAAKLCVAGVTDFSARASVRRHASDPAKALAGAPDVDLTLLLAHQPKSVFAARKLAVDLQLSGHTHGGQFFPWNLVIGLFHPLAAGLGRFDETWLYVNRGTGTWGPPLRTGVPAEITELELVRA